MYATHENLVLKRKPHEQQQTLSLLVGQHILAVDVATLFGRSVDPVSGSCVGTAVLHVLARLSSFGGLAVSANVEAVGAVGAEGGQDTLDAAHLLQLGDALGVDELAQLDGAILEGRRVHLVLPASFILDDLVCRCCASAARLAVQLGLELAPARKLGLGVVGDGLHLAVSANLAALEGCLGGA